MQFQLNGKACSLPDAPTIAELLDLHGHRGRRVAVEINQAIVPRSEHGSRRIADGDVIEIVQAIGGG